MSRRGENIYRRKDGRWEGRYQVGRKMDGKVKYRSIYGKSYYEVKHKLYPLKLAFASKLSNKGKCASPLYQWAGVWLDSVKGMVKPSTYANYRYKMEHYILPQLGDLPLNELESSHLETLVNEWRRQHHTPSTIHLHFQLIKRCLGFAVKKGLLMINPCKEVLLPKVKKRKIHALNKQEQKTLEQVARLAPSHQGLPVLIGLQTGMRIGEIAALKWENIDLKAKTLTVEKTYQRIPSFEEGNQKTVLVYQEAKTASSRRVVPLTKELVKKLKERKKKNDQTYVFQSRQLPCEPRLLTYYFHRLLKKAKLIDLHFHQLRHTFATRCMERSHDIASISALLGHASTQMTLDIYADSVIEQRKEVIRSLED
ncbi:MAG: site-specific integrase [Enterococcus sp.]|uniref:tyrosine-type recombinase/integrase n=1 Tax=Enterococcus sp. TaxID=35783 RepID=UPI0026477E18|nr:site-specific integrase [Enterococcus sp.]MDN6003120.1 site-specific integrase [Enterococcus sp.]MDN6519323.1 site-specific integrase [Enterococcus sp.]MDN6561354.1 site-specific integrase [Enterococcus sp.]MDN6618007.1 site-specific integrase [Enterococcus sp.]MDN6777746.1 site-specific integrase [Enterococcus sp.]